MRIPAAGPGEVEGVIGRPLRHGPTPFVLREFDDRAEADGFATRLQDAGAVAVVVSSEGACLNHPTELAGLRCTSCSRWICVACQGAAKGALLCPACAQTQARKDQLRRLRNWFAVFLFAVFLYQVNEYQRHEAAALESPVRVLIVQFAPARLLGHPRVRALNQAGEGLGRSLYDIAPFYQQEHDRYTSDPTPLLHVTVRGPWLEDVKPPPLGTDGDPGWKLLWRAWRFPAYFHDLARRHGVDPDNFGARLYVVWTDQPGDVAGESRGSRKGRVGISWLSVDEPNPAYSVVTIAHELGHVLGADDTYNPDSYLPEWPEGYVEPFVTPLWPQTWAELMAVDRPLTAISEAEVASLYQERIGYASAAQMGWIGQEQAELYYQPRLTTPQATLDEIKASRDAIIRGRIP